jgi:GR25 family glycosyltransferase involved in LPS biosynthesis
MKFEVYYMLGENETEKKSAVSEQFASMFSPDWSLMFTDETDKLKLIKHVVDNDGYIMIAEDGVQFTNRTEDYMRRCIEALMGRNWHIALSELSFANLDEAAMLFPPVDEMLRVNSLQMHGLSGVHFSGARCFLMNKWGKHSFLEAASRYDASQGAFDEFLTGACRKHEVGGFVVYPFPTSLEKYPKLARKTDPNAAAMPQGNSAPTQRAGEFGQLGQLAHTLAWIEAH